MEYVEKIREKGIEIDVVWVYENTDEIEKEEYETIELNLQDGSSITYYVLATDKVIQVGNYTVD